MPVDRPIYDTFPDPVVLLDRNRHVIYANHAARELLECRAEGGDLAMSIRHPAVLDAIDRLRSGANEHITEVTFPVPVERTFELNALRIDPKAPGAADMQAPVRDVLFFRDVTQAVRAEKMRVDFVANASHELRSPLAAVVGFIETLKGAASDDRKARGRFLDIMEREAQRMLRLIDDLLSLGRVEANEHVRPRGTVDVRSTVRAALDIVQARAQQRGVGFRLEWPDELPVVAGDADQLTQVFRNLIENAIIHGPRDSEIGIDIEAVSRIPESGRAGVVVRVHDDGGGIPKEVIPRLTERFYRVDMARSRSGPDSSTGLGLAIVKHIVARHRGRLAIESEPGDGTTFSIYIPSDIPVLPTPAP
ncbi:MAG: ATP-binding protein [Rhodospirillaceae bacterium]